MSQRKGCCCLKNDQHTQHLLETKTKLLCWCWGLQELRSGKSWKIITTPYQLPLSFSQQQQHLSVRYFLQRKGVTQWKVEAWVPWLTLIENPSPHEALPTICQRVYCIPTAALLFNCKKTLKFEMKIEQKGLLFPFWWTEIWISGSSTKLPILFFPNRKQLSSPKKSEGTKWWAKLYNLY